MRNLILIMMCCVSQVAFSQSWYGGVRNLDDYDLKGPVKRIVYDENCSFTLDSDYKYDHLKEEFCFNEHGFMSLKIQAMRHEYDMPYDPGDSLYYEDLTSHCDSLYSEVFTNEDGEKSLLVRCFNYDSVVYTFQRDTILLSVIRSDMFSLWPDGEVYCDG